MISETFDLLLNKKNCSGRGVRIRVVGPYACEQAERTAAKLASKDATAREMAGLRAVELLKVTVLAVTQTSGMKTREQMLELPASDWQTYSLVDFEKGKLDEQFTAKDYSILTVLMSRLYDVTTDELDDIMGGMLPVSTG